MVFGVRNFQQLEAMDDAPNVADQEEAGNLLTESGPDSLAVKTLAQAGREVSAAAKEEGDAIEDAANKSFVVV